MIGKLHSIVFDGPEPLRLAEFWAGVLGGAISEEEPDWAVVTDPAGRRLEFQRSPQHRAPRFPDPAGSQQLHLDIEIDVDDVDAAEAKVLALGGVLVTDAVADKNFRVFRDPAGHPFCLVWEIAESR